jgi:hypothetical protein
VFGVAVNGKVPDVPTAKVTVPVPGAVVSDGSEVGVPVLVGVDGAVVWVGALVAVITTGVLLGASVEVGRD